MGAYGIPARVAYWVTNLHGINLNKFPLQDIAGGVNSDRQGYEVSANQWTSVQNVTFRDGKLQKAEGYSEAYASPSIRPQWLIPYQDVDSGFYYWVYPGINDAGNGKIYSVEGTNHVDRTRYTTTPGDNDYTPSTTIPWTGGELNGLLVINNGVNVPQKWDRTAGILKTVMEDLQYWPANTTARSIRPFRNFLIAMDIDVSTNTPSRNPYRVMWSDAADPYTEPSSWAAAANNLAGDIYLPEGGDHVVDGASLRGSFIVYKENSTYIMRYVGGNTVFSADLLFNEHGILAPRCFAEFSDGMHFVVTKGDVIVHDGNTAKSVADDIVREKIFGEIDSTNYTMSYCTPFYKEEEVWFCYSTDSDSLADKAAIWNYKTGAWSFRTLPNAAHIAYGVVDAQTSSLGTWGTVAGTWATITGSWGVAIYNPSAYDMLMIERGDTDTTANAKFHLLDSGNTDDGTNMVAYAQRVGADFGDPSTIKHISRVYPKMSGGPVKIRVGAAMSQTAPMAWGDYQDYDPTTGDYKVDVRRTGRYIGYEIYSDTGVAWTADSLVFEGDVDGER